MVKKVTQSYWRLKPSKVPIWKQKNDDSRIGNDDDDYMSPKEREALDREFEKEKRQHKKAHPEIYD